MPLKLFIHQRPKKKTAEEKQPVTISREGHLTVDDCWHTHIKRHRTSLSKGQTHPLCVPGTKAREEPTKKYHELSKLLTYDQGSVVDLR